MNCGSQNVKIVVVPTSTILKVTIVQNNVNLIVAKYKMEVFQTSATHTADDYVFIHNDSFICHNFLTYF